LLQLLVIASCKMRDSSQDDLVLVKRYCRTAKPFEHPSIIGVCYPRMDDKTSVAATIISESGGSMEFYGDLAAVIIRVDARLRQKGHCTQMFDSEQDVPIIFANRFGHLWNFPADDRVHAHVAKWIIENRGKDFDSDLLREEISKWETMVSEESADCPQ